MARGESEARESNAAAVAIWSVFGVACLAAAWVVVRVSVEPEGPEVVFGNEEPHPGIEGPLHALQPRGCGITAGPHLAGPPGTISADAVARHLSTRGYEPARPFEGEERALPLEIATPELAGTCGVLAAVVGPGSYLEHSVADSETTLSCDQGVLLTPVCGDVSVDISGQGQARVGVFVFPGIVPDETLPADLVLAHAEAVTLLGAAGWSVVPEAMRVGQTAGTVDPLPEHPRGGCVPYVVAGLGIGHAEAHWIGRRVSSIQAPDRFLTGVVRCEGARLTQISGTVPSGASPVLVARPYRMGGPSLPTARATVPLEMVAPGDDLPLPAPVADRGEP